MLINKTHVKNLAKSYGKQIHDKDLRVSDIFVTQVNELIKAVVMTNVAKQDNLAATLKDTDWAWERLKEADKMLEREASDDV
jgi:ribosomal protein S20